MWMTKACTWSVDWLLSAVGISAQEERTWIHVRDLSMPSIFRCLISTPYTQDLTCWPPVRCPCCCIKFLLEGIEKVRSTQINWPSFANQRQFHGFQPCGSSTVFGLGKNDAPLGDSKIKTVWNPTVTAVGKYSIDFRIYVGLNSWEHLTKRTAKFEPLDTSLNICPPTADSRCVSFWSKLP